MKKSLLIIACTLFFVAVVAVVPTLATNNGMGEKPIWLVVTRPIFVEAIRPLAKMRSKDGFETIISTQPVADAITSLKRRPAFFLLFCEDLYGK